MDNNHTCQRCSSSLGSDNHNKFDSSLASLNGFYTTFTISF
jgi:hypothetical protein